jgi:hypothetical protein
MFAGTRSIVVSKRVKREEEEERSQMGGGRESTIYLHPKAQASPSTSHGKAQKVSLLER